VKRPVRAAHAAGIALLLSHASARAEDHDLKRAMLEASACEFEGVSEADLRAATALELEAQGIELAPAAELASVMDSKVWIQDTCKTGDEIALEASWAGQVRIRRLKLGHLPLGTRARALALALAELLGSFRNSVVPEAAELVETDPPSESADAPADEEPDASESVTPTPRRAPGPLARAPEPEPPPDAAPSSQSTARPTEIGVSPEGRLFYSGDAVAGMRPHVDFGILGLGLSVLGTSTTVPTGRLSALVVHAALALRLLQSSSAETLSVTAGPRLGFGLVRVAATGELGVTGVDAIEPYLDAGAYAMFELRPEPSLRFGLGFEAGHALGMVALSDSDPIAAYGGPFVGALLDLSLAL